MPTGLEPLLYRDRNLVERFFNKIKHCRRVAARYDKLAANYLAFVQLAAIRPLMSPRLSCDFRVDAVSLPLLRELAGTRATRPGDVPAASLMNRYLRAAIRGSRTDARFLLPV
jgi:hypothetical protein